jgi:hypothetical protein
MESRCTVFMMRFFPDVLEPEDGFDFWEKLEFFGVVVRFDKAVPC